MIYSIVQCLLPRNTFLHFSTSQKATRAAAYFSPFISTESEKRLAGASPRTISMRCKNCKVNSFSQEFPSIFYIKIVIKQERGGGGGKGDKLFTGRHSKSKNIQNKNINKKIKTNRRCRVCCSFFS